MTHQDINTREVVKIVQTAGRDQLGTFAPDFARYNDDILFGEVWSKNDVLSLHDRSIVTVSALISNGIVDNSLKYHLATAKKNGVTKEEMVEIITQLGFYTGWPKAWAAFNLAKDVYDEDNASTK
ncbi:carboxymuconolactone decarboxylase family protein [uncultured Veillonella sp.]|uniref:carboxymuconolactone decarboxylase family protein n=2 Tax=Veillonella TaxID=29465 RepID=UPI00258F4DC4|nr:carboxymuconolactone decarboxylase family protein [uncultured Veillonella sp.]